MVVLGLITLICNNNYCNNLNVIKPSRNRLNIIVIIFFITRANSMMDQYIGIMSKKNNLHFEAKVDYSKSKYSRNIFPKFSTQYCIMHLDRYNAGPIANESERKIRRPRLFQGGGVNSVRHLPFDNLILYISPNNYDNFIVLNNEWKNVFHFSAYNSRKLAFWHIIIRSRWHCISQLFM